ncbi:hypothetical protein BJ994_003469 [Arthrobacter pigmenti]|uniref:Uncharacterized protein n=1 Tax=Arthrobacter pigmenti TaxID=271432 RepID=A0A846RMC1_9MICC|nr:hypothetical protein [Arthrobacter pigmenti]NJC24393.1 hypothetical protein [Arthrobacter pigmenti]
MPALLAVPLQAALAVVVICALTGLTAFAVSRCLAKDDRDGAFWYGFTGGFASLGAITGALVLVPAAAPVIGLAGTLSVGLAGGWLWRGEQERVARRRRTQVEHARAALRARHESVLQRWVSYELDPAVAIDYPDMTNLKRPETAQLVRSMRNAAALREQSPENDDTGAPGYEAAVRELETAFEKAERAAGARTRK